MNVLLPHGLEKFVKKSVRSGEYKSASAVVRAALELLGERNEAHRAELTALRKHTRELTNSTKPLSSRP